MSEGEKHDQEKNRLDLIPPQVIEAVGDILTYGAVKYAPYNWFKGLKYSRVYGALQRHLNAWYRGEVNDLESGKPHLHHALCNITFLITYEHYKKRFKEFDDRKFLPVLELTPRQVADLLNTDELKPDPGVDLG